MTYEAYKEVCLELFCCEAVCCYLKADPIMAGQPQSATMAFYPSAFSSDQCAFAVKHLSVLSAMCLTTLL